MYFIILSDKFKIMGCALITADLHFGITSEAAILHLKQGMLRHNPDVIILAGDIGEPAKNFEECLTIFSDSPCPVGVIIGNHDLYNSDGRYHSEELRDKILPSIVTKHGFIWMEEETINMNGTAFIGTIAWYDYSSRAQAFAHLPDDFFLENKGRFVSDGNFIDWEKEDKEFSSELLKGLVKRLQDAQEDSSVRQIAVVSHVPLFPEQMVHYRSDNPYADAYFGNFTVGREVSRYSKVTDVISGHTHRKIDKIAGKIRMQVVPSDYKKPGYIALEL